MPRNDLNLYQCNPSTLKDTRTTCLPIEMLQRLRTAWNDKHPKDKIPASIRRKETLWSTIRSKMREHYRCGTEVCAVSELGTSSDRSAAAPYFRPMAPPEWAKNRREWHDTASIADVMEQYEKAYPQFEFIGPVPIDFDSQLPGGWGRCVVDELCSLDLAAIRRRGDTSVGIVFNLDPHDRPGSHWVCAFLDLVAGHAYYYDSYGYPPGAQVRRLLRRCREQGCTEIYWNDIRHQRKSSECGTYCMYVIISLLKGRSFSDICRNRVDDDTMNSVRDLLYATPRPTEIAIRMGARILGPPDPL